VAPSNVDWLHTPGANSLSSPSACSEMSAATPATIMAGRVLYSTSATSGALSARVAVTSLADESVPPPASVRLTWMSGWAAFHASTMGCCAVPQAQ
jgi:hypothetical protein